MIVKNIEKKEKNILTCQVEIDSDTFDKALNAAYLRARRQISVPGFRKGKVPRTVVEGMYGKDIFQEDALKDLSPEILRCIAGTPEIEAVDDPVLMDINISPDGTAILDCQVEVFPTAKLGQYKGIEITREKIEVTDEMIDKEIETARRRAARLVTVDRPAEIGDTCVIDFVGYVDGEPFDGGSGENYSLELGSNTFIPGFEAQLYDVSAGEEKDINVTFPINYHASALVGRDATFHVTVREVKATELPEVDDEFVRDISEFNTVEEYRNDLREQLQRKELVRITQDFDNELVAKVNENMTDYEIPESMIESRMKTISDSYKRNMGAQGMDDDAFCAAIGLSKEAYQLNLRPVAIAQVRTDILLHQVAAEEGFVITEKDIEEGYSKYAKDYFMSETRVREVLSPSDLRRELISTKALKVLEDNAIVTEVDKATKEAEQAAERERIQAEKQAKKEAEEAAEKTEEQSAEETPAEAE